MLFGTASADLESTMSAGTNFGPGAARMFANGSIHIFKCRRYTDLKFPGAQEYFDKYGANINHLAKIGTLPLSS